MSKDSQLLGSHVIASSMAANGIKRIHIFPGGTIGPVLDVVHNWNIEIFTTRHEQAAGYAVMWEERTGIPITQLVVLVMVDGDNPQIFIEHRDNWTKSLIESIDYYKKEYMNGL